MMGMRYISESQSKFESSDMLVLAIRLVHPLQEDLGNARLGRFVGSRKNIILNYNTQRLQAFKETTSEA
jgi:hypothetical protein